MGANAAGMEKAPVTLEQSITGMLSKVTHFLPTQISLMIVGCTNIAEDRPCNKGEYIWHISVIR
jgi:hypothetical protein